MKSDVDHDANEPFFDRLRECVSVPVMRVGPYEVIREAARGGQGTIYEALDTRDGSRVALKKPFATTAEQERKFLKSIEIASLLDHPFILKTIGTIHSEHSVWMIAPWVDGIPVNEWCDPAIRDKQYIVTLFLRICEAVIHAHSRGVIHRDLRPANILIRKENIPCLLDFGIAKRIDSNQLKHTATQSTLTGNVFFLAPEMLLQKRPVPDIRQDIYSLGVLFYTMLTSTHPLDGLPIREQIERISAGELFGAEINRELPNSLGYIIRKMTSVDINARYRTVQEVVDDVCDDRSGLPIRAREHTKLYLLRRFMKRNRTPISAIIVLVFGVLIGATLLTGMMERERGVRAANKHTIRMYANMIESLSPNKEVGPNAAGADILRFAAKQIDQISTDESRDELLARADIHTALASGFLSMQHDNEGIPQAEKAFSLYLDLLGRDHEKTQRAGSVLINLLLFAHKPDEAERHMHLLSGEQDLDRLHEPTHLYLMAMILSHRQDAERALAYFNKYIDSTNQDSPERATAYATRGMNLNRMSRPEDAIQDIQSAIEINSRVHGPAHAQTLQAKLLMVKSLQLLGRYEDVKDTLSEIMPDIDRVFGRNDPRTIRGWAHLSIADSETGFPERALDRAREVSTRSSEIYPKTHWNVVQSKFLIANCLLKLERAREVIDLLAPEMERVEEMMRERPIAMYQPRYWVARAYNDLGMHTEANKLLDPVVDQLDAKLGITHHQTLQTKFEYLRSLVGTRQLAEHSAAVDTLASQSRQTFGMEHPFTKRVCEFQNVSAAMVSQQSVYSD